MRILVIVTRLMCAGATASAEVVDASEQGFTVRAAVDIVLAGQLERLKRFVETGRPE